MTIPTGYCGHDHLSILRHTRTYNKARDFALPKLAGIVPLIWLEEKSLEKKKKANKEGRQWQYPQDIVSIAVSGDNALASHDAFSILRSDRTYK